MSYASIRPTTLALLSAAFLSTTLLPATMAIAAGSDTPSAPPASDSKKGSSDKKLNETRPDDRAFLDNYRAAYATIYDRHDYAAAITQLKALGHEDVADVANLIGYSYRKLGDYKLSQIYYERALKADPNHARTWQYYGLWQVEQGNRDQAQYHLKRLAMLTGKDSAEYKSLADALAQTPGSGLTY